MTAILERVPTERVSERASAARPGETFLRIVTGVIFFAAWLTVRALGLAWLAVAWVWAAWAEGWQAGMEANKRQAARRRAPA